MELLYNRRVLMKNKSNIWENIDGCADQYRCTTSLYLLSMLSNTYNIAIYNGAGSTGHDKDVVDGLDDTNKRFIYNVDDNYETSW